MATGYYGNEVYSGVAQSFEGQDTGILYTDRRKFYLDAVEFGTLYPNVAPFLAWSTGAGVINPDDPDWKNFTDDDDWMNQKFAVNGTPNDGTWAAAGDTINFNADGEVAIALGENLEGLVVEVWAQTGGSPTTLKGVGRVTSYVSGATDEITVKRLGSIGSGAAVIDDDLVYVIGNAQAEGSGSPEAWSTQPQIVWNSAQIEKTPIEITGTLYEAALRGTKVNEFARMQASKAKEHMIQRERKLLFGVRQNGIGAPSASAGHHLDSAGKPIRTTMGMIPMFDSSIGGVTSGEYQNVFTVTAATYDFDNFVDDTEKIFQYIPMDGFLTAQVGSQMMSFWNKIGSGAGFVGNTMNQIASAAGSGIAVGVHATGQIGYNYKTLETPHGVIRLVWNPLLRDRYAGKMLITDDSTIKRGVYRSPKYETAIHANDYDGQKDQYFSDEGLVVTSIRKNFLMNLA